MSYNEIKSATNEAIMNDRNLFTYYMPNHISKRIYGRDSKELYSSEVMEVQKRIDNLAMSINEEKQEELDRVSDKNLGGFVKSTLEIRKNTEIRDYILNTLKQGLLIDHSPESPSRKYVNYALLSIYDKICTDPEFANDLVDKMIGRFYEVCQFRGIYPNFDNLKAIYDLDQCVKVAQMFVDKINQAQHVSQR